MARLIDADALHPYYRTMLKPYNNGKCLKEYIAVAIDEIEKAPTVDAVPVIRCKDCKHCMIFSIYKTKWYVCTKHENNIDVKADDFCSKAERENNEAD